MNDQNKNCPTCGAAIPDDATGGICPQCGVVPPEVGAEDPDATRVVAGEENGLEDTDWLREELPDFELIRELGRGGMGRVFLARQISLDRHVAIKILTVSLAEHADFMRRFHREAQAMAKLVHNNIIQIYDYGETEHSCYIIMEYVEGTSLLPLIRNRSLTPEQALVIVPQICDALQFAHERGVIHRDIKPGNVMIGTNGQVKVADFGLAKLLNEDSEFDESLTVTGVGMGTPAYMAPEQMKDVAHVDSRADIYSLGVMFYEMLTGNRPAGRVERPSKKNLKIDVSLDEIVLKAMEEEPERRYQEVSGIKADLERTARLIERQHTSGSGIWKGLLIAAVVVALAGVAWWQGKDYFTSPEADPGVAQTAPKHEPDIHPVPKPVVNTLLLEEVLPIKAELDQWWDRLKNIDRGQGLGEKLDALEREVRVAAAYLEQEANEEARDAYAVALRSAEQVAELHTTREKVGTQLKALSANVVVPKETSDKAPAAWLRVEQQHQQAQTAFASGDFAATEKSLGETVALQEEAERVVAEVDALDQANQKLNEVLTTETKALLQKHTDTEWRALERTLAGSEGKTPTEARKAVERVLASLPVLLSKAQSAEGAIQREMAASAALVDAKRAWETAARQNRPLLDQFGGADWEKLQASLNPSSAQSYKSATLRLPQLVRTAQEAANQAAYDEKLTLANKLAAAEDWQQVLKLVEEALALNVRNPAAARALKERTGSRLGPPAGKNLSLTINGRARLELVWIPPGKFTMGTPETELKREAHETQHEVEITRGFWMGKYELTQQQWEAVTGEAPSRFKGRNLPVESIMWNEAVACCEQMTTTTRGEFDGWVFRLPTEAEWEYACRAGTATATAFGDDLASTQANFRGGSPYGEAERGPALGATAEVGSYQPNAWGLYDMHGNVNEWCADHFSETYYVESPAKDPHNTVASRLRVLRGGGWNEFGYDCRSGARAGVVPTFRGHFTGMRVVFAPQ